MLILSTFHRTHFEHYFAHGLQSLWGIIVDLITHHTAISGGTGHEATCEISGPHSVAEGSSLLGNNAMLVST